jgi:molybdopterin molybdotransferase
MAALIDLDTAIDRTTEGVLTIDRTETVSLAAASERVLAVDVVADRDLPPFNRAAMDGYAYDHDHAATSRPVCGHIQAGDPMQVDVSPGHCVGIATGAPVPPSCNTVVPHELTDRSDPLTITADAPPRGGNIHPQAADAARGKILINAGQLLSSAEVGIAAMTGYESLLVRAKPQITLLTSGDEVVGAGIEPASHQIRNSNHPMISMLAARAGGELNQHHHLADDPNALTAVLEHAADSADVIVTTGGISAGKHDFLPDAFEKLGCHWRIAGVAMKPGKPIRVGRLQDCVVVCLPGNPVSSLVTGAIFLAPIIRALIGLTPGPRWRTVRLTETIRSNPHRTLLRPAHTPTSATVSIPTWQGSGDLAHLAGTRGIVRLPLGKQVDAGTEVPFTRWP